MKHLFSLVIGFILFTPTIFASSTETTIYLSSIEKNLETGDQRIYYGAGNAVAVRNTRAGISSISYLHPDNLGGSSVITKNDGTKEASFVYYPFGKETTDLNLTSTDKFYTGQRKDSSSDLYFYNARYYNPKTSHFISADSAQGPNRYTYVGNNPIMRNDPSGNQGQDPRNPGISASGVFGNTTGGYGPGALGPGYAPWDVPCTSGNCEPDWLALGFLGGMAGAGALGAGMSAVPALVPYAYYGYTQLTQFLGRSQNALKAADLATTAACGVGIQIACTANDVVNAAQGLPNIPPWKAARRIETQKIIRAKYGLPPREMRFDTPGLYIERLGAIAHENNITIRPSYEFEPFFEENPFAGGVSVRGDANFGGFEGMIIPPMRDPVTYSGILEHELIHQLQPRGMSIWRKEYEAYMAGFSQKVFSDPEAISTVSNWLIRGSVRYSQRETREGRPVINLKE